MATRKPTTSKTSKKPKMETNKVLPVGKVFVDWEANPRGVDWGGKTDESLKNLRESIKDGFGQGYAHGLETSITVMPIPSDKKTDPSAKGCSYQLVAGYRRMRCMLDLSKEKDAEGKALHPWASKVPVIVKNVNGASDEEVHLSALADALTENLQRQTMPHFEEAKAYQRLKDSGMTGQEISKKVKKSPGYVSQHLSLNRLSDTIQELATEANVPFSAARELARLENEEDQKEAIELYAAEKLSAGSAFRAHVDSKLGKSKPAKKTRTPTVKDDSGDEAEAAAPSVSPKSTASADAPEEASPKKAPAAASPAKTLSHKSDTGVDSDEEDSAEESATDTKETSAEGGTTAEEESAAHMTLEELRVLAASSTKSVIRYTFVAISEYNKVRAGKPSPVFEKGISATEVCDRIRRISMKNFS